MENKELLNKIKVYRAMKNISQEELAVAIGVTRKTINTVETGKFIPSTVLSLSYVRCFLPDRTDGRWHACTVCAANKTPPR